MANCLEGLSVPELKTKLIGNIVYITYNGKTQPLDLSSISTEGGIEGIPKNTKILITEDGQTYFDNLIPLNETLIEIIINGQTYSEKTEENEEGSYIVIGRNVTWTGGFELEISDTLIIKTWQS